jgi:hypothetical protein
MKVEQRIGRVPMRLASLVKLTKHEPCHVELQERSKCFPFCGVKWALESLIEIRHYLGI